MLLIKDICECYSTDIKKLSTKFDIPFRTIQNWYYETNTPPAYVLKMMEYVLRLENELNCNNRFINHVDKQLELASDFLHDHRFGEAIEIIDHI